MHPQIIVPNRREIRRFSGGISGSGPALGLGATPSAFNPSKIPNLALWLEADYGVVKTGANVDSWTSRDPNGFVVTGAGATRPLFNAAGINGRASFTFSNVAGSQLDNTVDKPIPQSSARSLYVVAKSTDAIGGTLIDFGHANPDFAFQWLDLFALRFIFSNAAVNILIDAPPAINGVPYYFSWLENGTGSLPVFRANGAGYAITGGTTMPAEPAGVGFTIGNRFSLGGQTFTGEISAIIAYKALNSNAERNQVETYLKNKYLL